MKKSAQLNSNTLIIIAAIACIGCTTFGYMDEPACSERSISGFDPMSQPKWETDTTGFLDPMSFHSNQAYLVNVRYGDQRRNLTTTKLKTASSLRDLVQDYPWNWITDYVSVEISSTSGDITNTAEGKNEDLNGEQLQLLESMKIGDSFGIIVQYNTKNSATGADEVSIFDVSAAIVPETEAAFIGGREQMVGYLKENCTKYIAKDIGWLVPPTVHFIIDEVGATEVVELIETSGNGELDDFLVELIDNMPKWEAAKDVNGNAVTQSFEFKIGRGDC